MIRGHDNKWVNLRAGVSRPRAAQTGDRTLPVEGEGVEPAMQSSAMVAFRTLIIITCLVALPLAALTGTAVTKVVRTALDGRNPSPMLADRGGKDEAPLGLAPLVAVEKGEPEPRVVAPLTTPPTELAQLHPQLPTARITGVRAVSDDAGVVEAPSEPAIESAPLWNAPPRTASTPRTRDMTAHNVASPSGRRLALERSPREGRPQSLQKTVYSPPDSDDFSGQAAADGASDSELVSIEQAEQDNRFADSERRLRNLGASYYRLENWGDDGHFYRCCCSVAAAPHSRATRHFEAIDAAPSQAIESVIRQVQAWRNKSAAR